MYRHRHIPALTLQQIHTHTYVCMLVKCACVRALTKNMWHYEKQ